MISRKEQSASAAFIEAFGDRYDQVILVGDPLFIKRLLDHGAAVAVDWRRYHVSAIVGEETFGERFRGYMAQGLGLDFDHPEDGYTMSSLGVAELGLNLGFETPATIALRRLAPTNPAALEQGLLRELATDIRPERLVVWPYAAFPCDMGLEYECTFSHYLPGEPDPSASDGH